MAGVTRRRFLEQSASVAAAALVIPRFLHAAREPSVQFPSNPRERISVASYPFREFIAGKEHRAGNPTMELKDFAAHVVEKFGVHRIEPWSPHFPSTDPKYLEQFRAAIEQAGSGVADIAADGRHSVYAADRGEREKAIAFGKQWVDVAVALGSPSVRTHVEGSKGVKPDVNLAADSLKQVAEYGESKNVVLHLENDNPVSEDPFFLVQVIDKVNSPWLRALPDFGNSLVAHDEDYAYRGVEAMFAHAYGICHVKDGELNDQGKAVHVDLARTFGILKKRGYKGYCSIEYDAPGDPYRPTAELIQKTVQYLS